MNYKHKLVILIEYAIFKNDIYHVFNFHLRYNYGIVGGFEESVFLNIEKS